MTDLTKCPNCGGDADNGHDRSYPPNVYYCTKCENTPHPSTDVEDAVWEIANEASNLIDGAGTTEQVQEVATRVITALLDAREATHQATLAEVVKEMIKSLRPDIQALRNYEFDVEDTLRAIAAKHSIPPY